MNLGRRGLLVNRSGRGKFLPGVRAESERTLRRFGTMWQPISSTTRVRVQKASGRAAHFGKQPAILQASVVPVVTAGFARSKCRLSNGLELGADPPDCFSQERHSSPCGCGMVWASPV